MRVEEQQAIEKLALFFYFSLMDEARALSATSDTLHSIRRSFRGRPVSVREWEKAVINQSEKFLKKQKFTGQVAHLGFVQGQIQFPEKSNWGPWFEFRKHADREELSAVLWTKILGVSEEALAQAQSLTLGTVRFRVGRGLKHLGQYILREGQA